MRHTHRPIRAFIVAGLAIAGLAGVAYGQSPTPTYGVCEGYLVDKDSGEPVAWANVYVPALGFVWMSSQDGHFLFIDMPPGEHSIKVQHVGYAAFDSTVAIVAGDTLRVRFLLEPSVTVVDSIVVEAMHVDEHLYSGQTPIGIEARSLRDNMSGTVAATMATQPGVAEQSMGSAPARPVVRGLGGNRLLVLEDGGTTGDVSATSSDHAVTIEPLNAKRMEVIRGPAALMYGSAAIGGVVNVERDYVMTNRPDRWQLTTGVHAQSANTGRAVQARVDGPVGPLVASIDGTARTGDDMRTPVGTLQNTQIDTWNVTGGLSLIREKGHIGAAANVYRSDYGIPGGFRGGHVNGVTVNVEREHVQGNAHYDFGEGTNRFEVDGTYTRYYHRENEGTGQCGVAYGVLTYQTNARFGFAAGPLGRMTAGVQGEYRDFAQACFTFMPRTDEYSAGAYLYDEIGIGKTNLLGILRYDLRSVEPTERDFNDAGFIRDRQFQGPSGAIGIQRPLFAGFAGRATFTRSFRAPAIEELFAEGPHLAAYSYEVGNAELNEETGYGVEFNLDFASSRFSTTLSVFRNEFDGYIFATDTGEIQIGAGSEGFLPLYRYVGQDALMMGAEIVGSWQLSNSLAAEGFVSYVEGTLTETNMPLPRIPPLTGRLGLEYVRGSLRYTAATRAAAEQVRLGAFEEPTPGYVLFDAGIEWTLLAGSFFHSVTLRVDNIADTEYYNHLSRIKSIMPEPGRNVSLLYRISFF